jgi:HAE1 family hydrophobic/amphiphilic exporter-1
MWITDTSIKRPVTTITVMGAIVIFGLMAFGSMGIDLMPEVDIPVVTITTVLTGSSPEVIDREIADVIEEEVNTISGIKTLRSQSYEGVSIVMIEFELDKDIDVAAEEVRAKVNLAKRELPDDIEEPLVEKVDFSSLPIMRIAVYGDVDYSQLSHYADKILKDQLQSIQGVGSIETSGLRERQIRIWLDPRRLEAHNLTASEVVRAIQSKHVEMPGGRVETDEIEYTVKVEGEFTSVEGLKGLAVSERNGVVTYLKDVARVDDGFEDLRSVARYNRRPAAELGVRPQSGTNTVAVATAVKEQLGEIAPHIPEGIQVAVAFDSSIYIEESIRGVQIDIGIGILLTALVMYLFLRNVRVTFISVVAIPISLLGGFIAMQALGFTINFMTMLAMSLAVGMVIDDAIVVMENIFRHVEQGKEARKAASEGTAQVWLPVLAATSSIAAVFIPVAFMEGVIGRFFYEFGLTVAVTIIISALVSLTLTPFMSSRMLRRETSHSKLYVILENVFDWLARKYRGALEWAVGHRWSVVGIALLAFVVGIGLVPFIGSEFITQADESQFLVRFELPTGTSIHETTGAMTELEEMLLEQPEVESLFSTIGGDASGEINRGFVVALLTERHLRDASQRQVMDRMQEKFAELTDLIVSVEYLSWEGGGTRYADVEYIIQGSSIEELGRIGDAVVRDLESQGVFANVDTDLRLTKPEVRVNFHRGTTDDLGVDVLTVSNEIYTLFGGVDAAVYKEGGYRYDIRARALPEYRLRPEDLEQVSVRASDGRLIKAPNVVSYEVGEGPNVVNRYNRRRALTLYATVAGIPQGEALQRVQETVARHLPDDGNWSTAVSGMSQMYEESFASMFTALLVAILVIYMVLAMQFESFMHPFTIMVSLPLSMIGVFGLLLVTGKTLNIFSFIGIILLVGIVTKNSILLVDFANQERRRGADKVQAILTAGPLRLRPILMTAFSTMIAVVPVALAMSEGGETRQPMALAVIGGMLTSTLLTLLVIPVIYLIVDDAVAWVGRRIGGLRRALRRPAASAQGGSRT